MPKVFLFGYYGFGNLGDELLCDYYVRLFRDYFPGLELVVLTDDQHLSAQQGKADFTVANRWNLWRLGRMMAPGDLLVGGGGSIFQDITSKRSLLYYLALLRLAHRRGMTIILTGQGIGPLSPWGRQVARPVLSLAETIACRDQKSLQTLAGIGVNASQLYLGVDPLWDYPLATARLAVTTQGKRPPVIGFIFRAGMNRKKKHLLSTLNSLVGNLQLITLSPEDDSKAHKLTDELGFAPPWCIRDLDTFFTVASELTVVLSERLHGLLLAARYRIPGIGLGSDPKLHAFCHQMAWNCWAWPDDSLLQGVCAGIKKIFADPVTAYQTVRQQAEIMEQKGEEDRKWFIKQVKTALPSE